MNRIKILSLAMLAAAVVFSSCGTDDPDPIAELPGLDLNPTEFSGWYGDTLNIEYQITSNDGITGLDVTPSTSDLGAMNFDATMLNGEFIADGTVQYILPTGGNWDDGDSFTITFVATHDVDGTLYTKTEVVTVTYDMNANSTPLTDENVGVLNHILGPNEGAFNLVDNVTVPQSGDWMVKDMIHVTDGLSDTFNPVWTIGTDPTNDNGTRYVAAPGLDYDTVTLEDALMAYGDGTDALATVTFAEGDVYVAMLRGGAEGYAVIRIDAINMSAGNNDDTMDFSYKK